MWSAELHSARMGKTAKDANYTKRKKASVQRELLGVQGDDDGWRLGLRDIGGLGVRVAIGNGEEAVADDATFKEVADDGDAVFIRSHGVNDMQVAQVITDVTA